MTGDAPSAPPGQGTAARPMPRRRRFVAAIVAIPALVVVIHLAGVTGHWWPTPDSAVYLGLGRSIALGNGYRFNGEVHRTFAPGLPLMLAGLWRLTGESYWAAHVLMALCGLGALLAAYRSLRRGGAGREMAASAIVATGLSYTWYFTSHRILSDTPFALVFWLAVLFAGLYLRRRRAVWLVSIGLATMAAIALRAPGVLAIGALAVGVAMDRLAPVQQVGAVSPGRALRRRLLLASVIMAAGAAMGGGLYFLARRGAPEAPTYLRLVGPVLEVQTDYISRRIGHGLLEFPSAVAETFTSQSIWVLGVLLAILTGLGVFRLARAGYRLPAALLVIYPLSLCLCLGMHGMKPRYFMPVQPLMVLGLMSGAGWMREVLARRRNRWLAGQAWSMPLAPVGVAVLLVLANGPRLLRQVVCYGAASHSGSCWQSAHGAREADLLAAAQWLARECPPQARITAQEDLVSVVHYVTQRPTLLLPEAKPGEGDKPSATIEKLTAQAEASIQPVCYVLLEATAPQPAPSTLQALLAEDPRWREVFRGRFVIYESPGLGCRPTGPN